VASLDFKRKSAQAKSSERERESSLYDDWLRPFVEKRGLSFDTVKEVLKIGWNRYDLGARVRVYRCCRCMALDLFC
jgi:hypothetical protein